MSEPTLHKVIKFAARKQSKKTMDAAKKRSARFRLLAKRATNTASRDRYLATAKQAEEMAVRVVEHTEKLITEITRQLRNTPKSRSKK